VNLWQDHQLRECDEARSLSPRRSWYAALREVETKTDRKPLEVLVKSIDNMKPKVE